MPKNISVIFKNYRSGNVRNHIQLESNPRARNRSNQSTSAPPGAVAFFIMKPDNEENDLIAIAVFESKQDYLNNANRPEQHDAFVNMMTHLQEEPTWNDGTYIVSELK